MPAKTKSNASSWARSSRASGKKTRTGMSEKQLEDMASKKSKSKK